MRSAVRDLYAWLPGVPVRSSAVSNCTCHWPPKKTIAFGAILPRQFILAWILIIYMKRALPSRESLKRPFLSKQCSGDLYFLVLEVMSGSEVSTHPTENVQKTKRFFSQVRIIEKFTFMKNQKFYYFSKEKLLFSKILFTELTHRVRFSTRPVNTQWA